MLAELQNSILHMYLQWVILIGRTLDVTQLSRHHEYFCISRNGVYSIHHVPQCIDLRSVLHSTLQVL